MLMPIHIEKLKLEHKRNSFKDLLSTVNKHKKQITCIYKLFSKCLKIVS